MMRPAPYILKTDAVEPGCCRRRRFAVVVVVGVVVGVAVVSVVVFGVAGDLDGTVNVYHKGFICVKWEYGRRPYSKTFYSKEEVVELAKERNWLA